MSKPKIIAIVGPTASGKTSLSINIAKKFNGEVISADSRQVYCGLNIGTGKLTENEMEGIPHHLLDIINPNEIYTAVDFRRDATTAISDINSRCKQPIIAGGTFFYIELLRGNTDAAPIPPNKEFRMKMSKFSNSELMKILEKKDPRRAANIDQNNQRRIIRALEIIDSLGYVPEVTKNESSYEWLVIGMNVCKEKLLDNYAKRIEKWLDAGFTDEVINLLKIGISNQRFQEIGFEYTLMLEHINGKLTLNEFKKRFVQKNWQYAKRQITWLKRDEQIEWFAPENREAIFRRVETFLNQ